MDAPNSERMKDERRARGWSGEGEAAFAKRSSNLAVPGYGSPRARYRAIAVDGFEAIASSLLSVAGPRPLEEGAAEQREGGDTT